MTTTTTSGAPDREPRPDNVVPLRKPADPDTTTGAVERVVLDGEIVTNDGAGDGDRPGTAVVPRRPGALTRYKTVHVITTAVRHPRTKTVAKGTVRQVWFPLAGAGVVIRRWQDTHGARRYERMMRAAEAAGDHEALLEWEARDVAEKARRHQRVMDWIASPLQLVKALAVGAAALTGLLLALGVVLAIANGDAWQVIGPITAVIDAIAFLVWFFTAYGTVLLTAATVGGVAYLWQVGRAHAAFTPGWMAAPQQPGDEVGALVTADGIVTALQHLPIPKLKEAFKQGWLPRFELTPTREGQGVFRGYRAIFDLPMGVTPQKVADLGDVLARNLHRIKVEVWASDYGREKGGKAGYVNLYVADSGVMDKPTPEYPLLHEGAADVFVGVPIGITQRGDTVMMPIVGSNAVFGGQPGQGKSNAVRVAVAGASLDPLCEIRIHVFALNGDFDAYEPRLSRYEKGATAEHVASAAEHLQQLYDEVGRREGRLAQLGAKKLTRTIAEKHPDMRPLLVGFSECHEMFSHAEHGKLAAELAIQVVKRGRKTGVSLVFDTQSSRADAIPSQLVENVGFNGCFAVKTWRSNDGFLGDGSFAAGIRATELRFNVDRGTMVATGASEELFDIVRTFFIKVDDDAGWDQAAEIIERAMAQLDPRTPTRGSRPAPAPAPARDPLADIAAVLVGHKRLRTQEVLSLLAAKDRAAYGSWTFTDLADALPDAAKPYKTGGQMQVSAARVAEALADRDTPDDAPDDSAGDREDVDHGRGRFAGGAELDDDAIESDNAQ
jgi:S-DNA-T family DNA segregation ATPase FtsK/SpoIIIE